MRCNIFHAQFSPILILNKHMRRSNVKQTHTHTHGIPIYRNTQPIELSSDIFFFPRLHSYPYLYLVIQWLYFNTLSITNLCIRLKICWSLFLLVLLNLSPLKLLWDGEKCGIYSLIIAFLSWSNWHSNNDSVFSLYSSVIVIRFHSTSNLFRKDMWFL